MSKTKKRTVSIVLIIVAAVAAFLIYKFYYLKSVPTDSGLAYKDMIVVNQPAENGYISSPVTITGEARGSWYFEASFPVILVNWDGLIIAQGHAQAKGDWMTQDYVPFEATLEFEKPSYGERGAIILKKDNPSGMPQNDDAFEIPIKFK